MTKQPSIVITFATLIFFFSGSCTHEQLAPNCDTQNMSYANNVVPILKSNCYKCHSEGNSVGSYGHLLDSYENLQPYTTRDTTVIAGDTTIGISFLEGVITHAPGYIAMPYMAEKLDTCAIKQIIAWISQGALDN
jgi:hypothetical protein